MDVQERRILTVTSFGHFLSHFNMLVFPAVVLPLRDRLGLDLSEVLQLSFWHYLLFGLTALPWGLAADRWGARPFLLVYFLGSGLCGFAAAWFIDSPGLFSLSLAGIGLFSGVYHPTGLGLISKGIRRLSLAMGYNGMFGNVGLAAAPMITGLVTYLSGPAAAFAVLGLLNLGGAVMTYLFRLEEPEKAAAHTTETGPSLLKPFVTLCIATMLGGITYQGATIILPTYFELRAEGLYHTLTGFFSGALSANLVAATLTSIIYIIGILGQLVGGRVGERFDLARSYFVFHALTLPALFLMSFAADLPLVLLTVHYFFFLLGMQPLENTLVARLAPPSLHHSAYGVKFVLTFGVGSLAVKLVAYIQDKWGLDMIFPALGVVTLALIAVLAVLLVQTGSIRRRADD